MHDEVFPCLIPSYHPRPGIHPGSRKRVDPRWRDLRRRGYDHRDRPDGQPDREVSRCRAAGRGRQARPPRLDLRPHAFLRRVRPRHGDPGAPATNFVEILERLWWKLDRALLWDDIRYSALICLVDAIRHGCATLIDHHASPNAIDGSLDIIADAVKEAGLRASLCYEVTDRNGMDGARAGIAENVRFLKRCAREQDPQLAASFGLHAALTLSDETLEASIAAVESLPPGGGTERGRLPHPRRRRHRRPGGKPAQVQPARGRAAAEVRHPGAEHHRRALRAPGRVREGYFAGDRHAGSPTSRGRT